MRILLVEMRLIYVAENYNGGGNVYYACNMRHCAVFDV